MNASTVRRRTRLLTVAAIFVVSLGFGWVTLLLLRWPFAHIALPSTLLAASVGAVTWRSLQIRISGALGAPRAPGGTIAEIFGLGAVFGFLASGLRDGASYDLLVGSQEATPNMSDVVGAAVIGVVLTLVLGSPLRASWHLISEPSMETLDLALRHFGAWLIGVAALIIGFGCIPALFLTSGAHLNLLVMAVAGFGAVGFGLWGVAAARLERRARWFERVFHDQEPEWTLMPIDEVNLDLSQLLPLRGSRSTCDAVILRRLPGKASGAYRTGEELQPFAMASSPLTPRRFETAGPVELR